MVPPPPACVYTAAPPETVNPPPAVQVVANVVLFERHCTEPLAELTPSPANVSFAFAQIAGGKLTKSRLPSTTSTPNAAACTESAQYVKAVGVGTFAWSTCSP